MTFLSISPISPSARMESEPNRAPVTNARPARICLATRSMFLAVVMTGFSCWGFPFGSSGITTSPSTGMLIGRPLSILMLSISLKRYDW